MTQQKMIKKIGIILGFLILSSLAIVSRFTEVSANHTTVTPSGGFHACNVVGQTTAGTDSPTAGVPNGCDGGTSTVNLNLFAKSSTDNGPVDRGMSGAADTELCNGYLWTSDYSNNRVLGFAVNGNNVLIDRIADVVFTGNGTDNDAFIGANAAGTTQSSFNGPTGLACDSANKRLFVLDQNNNRVLIFNVTTPTNGMNASKVLGQADFTTATAATTQTGLKYTGGSPFGSSEIAYYNNLLFIADTLNHRVIVQNVNTFNIANGQNASKVLGQADFTTATAATTQSGMNQPIGVEVDTIGDQLFVADNGNHRVLLYDILGFMSVGHAVGGSGTILKTIDTSFAVSSQTSGTSNGLNSVYFVSGGRTGYAVGDSGTILKTTNGGTSWSTQTSGTTNHLYGVTCIDANTCYASGGTGSDFIILKTTNGGTTWTNKASGTNVSIKTVGCADANTCWFPKNGGSLAKTSDGASSFTLLTSGTSNNLNGISVIDTNTVYIVGASGTIIKTTDGGTNWSTKTSGTSNGLNGVYFIDTNTGYAVGDSGTILKTTNGGTSWSAQTSGTLNNLKSISCNSVSICFVVGASGTFLLTANSGTTWSAQTSGTSSTLNGVNFAVGTNGDNASNVLGQANFTTGTANTQNAGNGCTTAVNACGMQSPEGLAYDAVGTLLYVVDTGNARVLVHNVASPSNGQSASNVLGQANFTSATMATTSAGLSGPTGIGYDSTNKLLFVGDSANSRVIQYDVNAISNGENATDCLGQLGASDACVFTKGTANNRPNARGVSAPRGVTVGNNKLFVSDTGNNRILVYNLDSNGQLVDRVADNVLGQASLHSGTSAGTTSSTLSSPRDLAYDSTNNRLFVLDYSNNRVLVYNVATISDGQAAANVLCQGSFTSSSTGTTQTTCNFPVSEVGGMNSIGGLAFDSTNNRLFVSDSANGRVLVFDVRSAGSASSTLCSTSTTGIANGMNASCVIGQANMTSNSCAYSQAGLCNPGGLAYDSGNTRLFVADISRSGVMMYDLASSISNGMPASAVIGQSSYTAFSFPMTVTSGAFPWPQGLAYDGSKYLFISTMNTQQRIMIYDVTPATLGNGQSVSASGVIGQASFSGASANTSLTGIGTTPEGMYYDTNTNRLYLADRGNNRINAYDLSRVTNTSLSNCEANSSCSRTITSEDSQFTLSYSVASGSLPAGLSLNSSTGALTGTPTATGTASFTIAATDTASGGFFTAGSRKALSLIVADTTAPTSSSIASAPTSSGATITWTTDEASSSIVLYGLTSSLGSTTSETDTSPRVASHSVTLSGLTASTLYHFKIKSIDAANNAGISSDQTFTTTSGGTGQHRKDTLSAQVDLTISLGSHRDSACLSMVNQLLKGTRAVPGRVTLAQDLGRVAGRGSLGSLADLLENTALRGYLNSLVRQDSNLADLLACQSSHSLTLEVWDSGKAGTGQPLASVDVSTDLFGKASVTLPSLEVKSYDFTLRKPFGLRQTLAGQTLAASMSLTFQTVHVGDVDGDGRITLADFKRFMQNLGSLQDDFNEDGKIDLRDVADFLEGMRK